MLHTPLDAVPDISDVQVIVATEWPGRSPDLIEDQVTYPLVTALVSDAEGQGGPRLHRLRDLVRLRHLRGRHRHLLGTQPRRRVPAGHPRPAAGGRQPGHGARRDGRGLGVPVRARRSTPAVTRWRICAASRTGTCAMARERAGRGRGRHHRRLREAVPGQPRSRRGSRRTRCRRATSSTAIQRSNNDVEGRLLEFAGREYMVRGRGYSEVGGRHRAGVARRRASAARRCASATWRAWRIGPELRRGAAELDGQGEVVGGIVVMRFGENALRVIDRVKARMHDVAGIAAGGRRDRADLRSLGPHPRVDRRRSARR